MEYLNIPGHGQGDNGRVGIVPVRSMDFTKKRLCLLIALRGLDDVTIVVDFSNRMSDRAGFLIKSFRFNGIDGGRGIRICPDQDDTKNQPLQAAGTGYSG